MASLYALGPLFFWLFALLLSFTFFITAALAISRAQELNWKETGAAGRGLFWLRYARLVRSRRELYLMSALVGAFLSALFLGFVIENLTEHSGAIFTFQLGVSSTYASSISVFLVALVAALVGLLLLSIGRSLAQSLPFEVLCGTAAPLVYFGRVFLPLSHFFLKAVEKSFSALRLSLPKPETNDEVSTEELSELVEKSSDLGPAERDMIHQVFGFSETVVREVMTPRPDIVAVSGNTSLEEVVAVLEREKLSRLLVIGDDLDDVRGVLMAKDLLPYVGKSGADFSVADVLRPASFVPNSKPLHELLKELRREAIHLAVVVDEHGCVDGVVSLEDVLEELVGEIEDEYDTPDQVEIKKTSGGDLIVDGSTSVSDLNDSHSLDLPIGEYDTVAGLLLHLIGHVPVNGEFFDLGPLRLKAERVENSRIAAVRVIAKRGQLLKIIGSPESSVRSI